MKVHNNNLPTHEFLVFNRGDRLWVDAWIVHEATEKCQQIYIVHNAAWHNKEGILEELMWGRYRWIRHRSEYYRLREKGGKSWKLK